MWIRQTLLINIYLRISWSINNMTIKCLRIYNSTIINEYIISTEIDAIVLCSRREVCSNKRLSQCSITYFSESVSICHYYIKSSQQMISVVVCLSSCIYSRYKYNSITPLGMMRIDINRQNAKGKTRNRFASSLIARSDFGMIRGNNYMIVYFWASHVCLVIVLDCWKLNIMICDRLRRLRREKQNVFSRLRLMDLWRELSDWVVSINKREFLNTPYQTSTNTDTSVTEWLNTVTLSIDNRIIITRTPCRI